MGNTPPYSTSQKQALAIVPKVGASLSLIGSLFILQDILRDPSRRQKLQFRLLLGMSLLDAMFSIKNFLSTWIIPAQLPVYLAAGTQGTCTAAGFIGQLTNMGSIFYNASLALYFVWTIRQGWRAAQLRRWEWVLHAVPLGFGLSTAIAGLPLNLYNPTGWTCWIGAWPPFCDKDGTYDKCTRGINAHIYKWAFGQAWSWSIVVFAAICMILIYVKISRDEQRTAKYMTRASMKGKTSSALARTTNNSSSSSTSLALSSKNAQQQQPSSSPQPQSLSRAFAKQALLYVLALYLTYFFTFVRSIVMGVTGKNYYALTLLMSIFIPLQGFFNAIVYVRPRYLERVRTLAKERALAQKRNEQLERQQQRMEQVATTNTNNNNDSLPEQAPIDTEQPITGSSSSSLSSRPSCRQESDESFHHYPSIATKVQAFREALSVQAVDGLSDFETDLPTDSGNDTVMVE